MNRLLYLPGRIGEASCTLCRVSTTRLREWADDNSGSNRRRGSNNNKFNSNDEFRAGELAKKNVNNGLYNQQIQQPKWSRKNGVNRRDTKQNNVKGAEIRVSKQNNI